MNILGSSDLVKTRLQLSPSHCRPVTFACEFKSERTLFPPTTFSKTFPFRPPELAVVAAKGARVISKSEESVGGSPPRTYRLKVFNWSEVRLCASVAQRDSAIKEVKPLSCWGLTFRLVFVFTTSYVRTAKKLFRQEFIEYLTQSNCRGGRPKMSVYSRLPSSTPTLRPVHHHSTYTGNISLTRIRPERKLVDTQTRSAV
jgi:hypothetical protein